MKGTGVSEGIAIGRAWLYSEALPDFSHWPEIDAVQGFQRFLEARGKVSEALAKQGEKAASSARKDRLDILEAHSLMLADPELERGILAALENGQPVPAAVNTVMEAFAEMMGAMADPYLQQRSQDLLDLRNQLLRALAGVAENAAPAAEGEWIVLAQDFMPSAIELAETPFVTGFLCQQGGATTHFSILVKNAGLPLLVQVPNLLQTVAPGDLIVADGGTGEVIVNPEPELLASYRARRQAAQQFQQRLACLRSEPAVTLDGRGCHLEGNIAGPQDVLRLMEVSAEGVGLFRTEFIYMDRSAPPTEEEQLAIYSQVLADMAGRPVVIRTLDVGGDKALPYLGISREENPFLGFRAVRYCLAHPDIFRTQLRALLRASVHGSLKIMVPMISSLEEVRAVKVLLGECREELRREGHALAETIDLGIMVEVPAAAAMAPLLAQESDFFSIGTNDLIQYVMAADRMNPAVAYLYTPYHPAFIRTLKAIIEGAHSAGIPAAMCGELAGDPDYIPVLLGLGLDAFSMNAGALLKARWRIRTLRQDDCEALVQDLMALKTVGEIREAVTAFNGRCAVETA